MNAKHAVFMTAAALLAASAFAAPKIDSVVVKPNPAAFAGGKAPEVEVSVSVARTRFDGGNCDARVEFGDGEGRSVDFGVATTRTVRHVYKKGGNYRVVARGAGKNPCEGTRDLAFKLTGGPAEKKAMKKTAAKKDAKKKGEKKKDEKNKDEPK